MLRDAHLFLAMNLHLSRTGNSQDRSDILDGETDAPEPVVT
jgi:hypothetical protein